MRLAQFFQSRERNRSGLSLQEMLVVIAVFAILAIIFFVSSVNVMTKTKVSKTRHDMRSISDNLKIFRSEHLKLPSSSAGLKELVDSNVPLNRIPRDPFSNDADHEYRYYSFDVRGSFMGTWILASSGPDGDDDFDPAGGNHYEIAGSTGSSGASSEFSDIDLESSGRMREYLQGRSYDPTNGIISDGDIFLYDFAVFGRVD